MNKMIGIVLAGGQSKRFGQPKAFAKRNGKEFILYSIEALQCITKDVVVVIHPEIDTKWLQRNQLTYIQDLELYQGKGPLAGIYSVMSQFKSEWYIVLPCDTPFINSHLLKKLQLYRNDGCEAIVPSVHGNIQPLIAMYHHRVKEKIRWHLEQNKLSMKHFLPSIHTRYVEINDDDAFININTKDEYDQYIVHNNLFPQASFSKTK